jgi:hypothetical protein
MRILMRHLLAHFNRRILGASLVAVACFAAAGSAFADDYSEVSRLLRAGQLGDANVKVDQLLAAKPQDPQLRFFKGVIQSEQGKPQDAINTFTKLTQDYPELPEPYNNLAVLYAGQSQFDKARASLEMAIRTNPSYATAHENLGDIYAKLASQAYSKALQLDAGNSAVQPKLSLIRDIFAPGGKTVRAATVASAKTTTAPALGTPPVAAKTAAPPVAASPVPAAVAAAVPASKYPAVVSAPPLAVGATAKPVASTATAKVANKAESKVENPGAEVASASDADVQAVEGVVRAWARAWAKKDMKDYYAAYGNGFKPADGSSRSAWEADRKSRIVGKNKISVELSNIRVALNGDKATARFRQNYQGDALRVSSNKSLALAKEGGRWVIVRELAGS